MKRRRRTLETGFALLFAIAFAFAAIDALEFPFLARLFPLAAALCGLAAVTAEIVRTLKPTPRVGNGEDSETVEEDFLQHFRQGIPVLCWIGGYYLGIFLLGFLVASALFVLTFLTSVARWRPITAVSAAAALVAAILGFGWTLTLEWPQGLLQAWLEQVA